MFPDIVKIGPFTLHSFGLMAMLGFLIPSIIMRGEFRRKKIDPDFASTIAVAAIIGGFIGARAYYLVEHWQDFLADPLGMIFSGAGLVWYGGFIGGAAAVIYVIKHNKLALLPAIDLIAPMVLLGHVFGRGGCFLSGDGDYGPPSDLPWAMSFPKGVVSTRNNPQLQELFRQSFPGQPVPEDIAVHPTPLYDIALGLLFFMVLWKLRKNDFPAGTMFGLYLIAAGAERFITEFWRNTPKIAFGWMSLAQMISIALIVGGVFFIHWAASRQVASPVRTAVEKGG